MKLTITTTYTAEKMKVKDLLEIGYGEFIESKNDVPLYVSHNLYYLSALNPKRKVYHLTEMEETTVLK